MAGDLIVEAGAHDGDNTAFFLAKGFRVVAIEPNPACIEHLRQRFAAQVQDQRLTLVEMAAHETAGLKLPFAITPNARWSRLVVPGTEQPAGTTTTLEVTTIDYREILARWGCPHFLHVHINTHEPNFLKSLEGVSEKPENICAHVSGARAVALLYDLGYRAFKLVTDHLNTRHRLPNPPLEGNAALRGEGIGWSGYFGQELPGSRWFPIESMATALEALSQLRRLETVFDGPLSIHARMEAQSQPSPKG